MNRDKYLPEQTTLFYKPKVNIHFFVLETDCQLWVE